MQSAQIIEINDDGGAFTGAPKLKRKLWLTKFIDELGEEAKREGNELGLNQARAHIATQITGTVGDWDGQRQAN